MSDLSSAAGPRQRGVEIGVALATALFGVVVMIGSVQVGIGWGDEGPRAGFFPFYVGLVIVISSAVNLIGVIAEIKPDAPFASWQQLRSVLSVVLPTAAYVATLPYLGIYVTSALLLAVFMKWFGRYSWLAIAIIAIGVPVLTYVTFERWFLVPLPKGPLEGWFGL